MVHYIFSVLVTRVGKKMSIYNYTPVRVTGIRKLIPIGIIRNRNISSRRASVVIIGSAPRWHTPTNCEGIQLINLVGTVGFLLEAPIGHKVLTFPLESEEGATQY